MQKFNTHFYIIDYLIIFTLIGFFTSFIYASPELEKLNVPDGFEISIYADELDSPRQLAETDEGYIVVGSKKEIKFLHFMIQTLMDMLKKEFLFLKIFRILLELLYMMEIFILQK